MRDLEPLISLAKLYLATSTPQAFREKIGNIDWNAKAGLLKKQKLTAVFQQTSLRHKTLFPREIAKNAFIDQSLKLAKKKRDLAEMERIQKAFANKDICVLPYKGLALADQFYGDLRPRDTGDMDFAIDRKDLAATKEVMEALGYVEKKEESDFTNLGNSRSYYIDYSWVIYDADGYVKYWVEYHWQPANYALYCPYLFENLQAKSTTLAIAGRSINTFEKVEHALLVIIHHGIVDGWGELRHLVDLVKVLEGLDDKELERLAQLSKQYKVYKSFCMGISLVEKMMDFSQERLQKYQLSSPKIKTHTKAILQGDILGDWSEKPIKLWYYLRMRDSMIDLFKSIFIFFRFLLIELRLKFKPVVSPQLPTPITS